VQSNDQYILIKHLKSFPRHGMADPNADSSGWEAKSRDLEARLKTLTETLPSLNAILQQYDTIINKISDSNTQLSMGLGKVIGIQEQYAAGVNSLVKNITFLEERNKALNKSYGVSSITAAKYAKQLRTLAVSTEIGADKLMGYADNLKGLTAGMLFAGDASTGFRKNLLLTQQFLQNNLGVTAAAAEGYEYYASTIADSGAEAATMHEQLSKTLSSVTGIDALQLQKDLTQDIGSLTADLQMRYSRIPGSLELAVLKSKALGTSLEGLNSAGDNLLNIESSIGSELEYQLLSGKRLLTQDGKSLTNAYRMATLQGDANKQAELMNDFLKDQGPVLEKNLFARKKAAELMGTDEATIARMLQKQKIMSELGVEKLMRLNQNDITSVVSQLRKDGVDESKIQELIKTTDNRSTAQIANDYLKSIDEKIINLSGVDVGATRTTALAGAKSFEDVMRTFSDPATMKAFGTVTIFGETIGAITDPLSDLIAKIPGFGETISAAINKITGLVPQLQTGNTTPGTAAITDTTDALIMPDRGPILRPAPNDVIAAFRPGDVIDRTLKGGGSGIDYNKLATSIAAAMRNVNLTVKMERDIYSPTTLNPIGRRT